MTAGAGGAAEERKLWTGVENAHGGLCGKHIVVAQGVQKTGFSARFSCQSATIRDTLQLPPLAAPAAMTPRDPRAG